jgi:hypothetical protein
MIIAEERIFATTNYYDELTNFYPNTTFKLFFVGPELSVLRNGKEVKRNDRLSGTFYKGNV